MGQLDNEPGSELDHGTTDPETHTQRDSKTDLVVDEDAGQEKDGFARELERTLDETKEAVLAVSGIAASSDQAQSWERARELVKNFRPVPWFIWRLANYVLGKAGQIKDVPEGMVFGLRRLLFAAASDKVLGAGEKINNQRQALKTLSPDVFAATAVIHAIGRKLASREFERIWRPILDDALVRAQIGFHVGQFQESFGSGRGMLAGFAGRAGLAILIAGGKLEQARECLELLATGSDISQVGRQIYNCDPLQVSAMTLSAAGCGRDAAFGTVNYAARGKLDGSEKISPEQQLWLAAFTVTEHVRTNRADTIDPAFWDQLGFTDPKAREDLIGEAKLLVRRGHGWSWLV